MSILDHLLSLFNSDDQLSIDYDDPVSGINEITFSKTEFMEFLNHSPNLHEDHLMNVIQDGDIESIAPHLDGAFGNMMAQKYFANIGAVVDSEVHSGHGIIDLVVSPESSLEIVKVSHGENGIEFETESMNDPFAVEVKSYCTDSFHQVDLQHISEQIDNGDIFTGHSYLGVTRDFLDLDWDMQKDIIDMAESRGDGLILLPYNKISLDDTLTNLLNQI